MIFDLFVFLPASEPTHFAVIAIISKPHLRTNQEYSVIVDDDTAVVQDILMYNWPSYRSDDGSKICRILAHIPISHRIPSASLSWRIEASISQECNTVSPV